MESWQTCVSCLLCGLLLVCLIARPDQSQHVSSHCWGSSFVNTNERRTNQPDGDVAACPWVSSFANINAWMTNQLDVEVATCPRVLSSVNMNERMTDPRWWFCCLSLDLIIRQYNEQMTDQLVRNVIDDFVYNSLKWWRSLWQCSNDSAVITVMANSYVSCQIDCYSGPCMSWIDCAYQQKLKQSLCPHCALLSMQNCRVDDNSGTMSSWEWLQLMSQSIDCHVEDKMRYMTGYTLKHLHNTFPLSPSVSECRDDISV